MGGEHKCPLCAATFTRPQHVGRHLRAHTGDRPYECKECPLKFARSDLLSRHVNKTHAPADGEPPKEKEKGKKARRKSLPAPAAPLPPPVQALAPGQPISAASPRRASMSRVHEQVVPPPLQAQSMYPHHPLLMGEPQGWTSNPPPPAQPGVVSMVSPMSDFSAGPLGIDPGYGAGPSGYSAVPMRMTGSDQSLGSSSMGRGSSGFSAMGYEFGFKKRACDQCNHSKVRCDFAEPCQRCTTRNISCTYLKPTKSRSMVPTQRLSLPTSSGYANSYITNASVSPQTTYSSPHSTGSPPTATLPANFGRPPTTAPPPLDKAQSMPYIPVTAMPWGNSYPDVTVPSPSMSSTWNQSFTPNIDPLATLASSPQTYIPGTFTSPTGSVPIQPAVPPMFSATYTPGHRLSASSGASPQTHLATPSLTASHTTSPSSSDGPTERQSFSTWNDPQISPGVPLPMNQVIDNSPYSQTLISPVAPMTNIQPDFTNTYANNIAWSTPQPNVTATIDPRFQFRSSYTTDDEDVSTRPPSSAASTYHVDFDDVAVQAAHHRRRSSAGVWASAFNNMSLAEQQSATNLMPLPDPYTASQYAQQVQQVHTQPPSAKRPSFPFIAMEGSEVTQRLASSGDMKDLWKLFMSDQTPSVAVVGDKMAEAGGRMGKTPSRPGMGLRRRSSMPEFSSPPLTAKGHAPFFTQQPGEEAPPPPVQDGSMNTWKKELRARGGSFTFVPTLNGADKLPGGVSQLQPNLNPNLNLNSGRPIASILQHNPALFQTLAPERAPSFGVNDMTNPVLLNNTTQRPVMPYHQHQQQAVMIPNVPNGYAPHKVTSALARPGNKRLASQTLVPDLVGKSVRSSSGLGYEDVVELGGGVGGFEGFEDVEKVFGGIEWGAAGVVQPTAGM